MPLYYQFRDYNGELVSLDFIDELICKHFGIPCSSTSYSTHFQLLTMIGDICMSNGEFSISKFENAVNQCSLTDAAFYYYLLNGRYHYRSWNQR